MILTTESYDAIQSLKAIGLKQSQVADRTGISRPTVKKYWNMPREELLKSQQDVENAKQIHQYKDEILHYLTQNPKDVKRCKQSETQYLSHFRDP